MPADCSGITIDPKNNVSDETSDASLFARLASGDSDALGAIMDRHVDRLHKLAHVIVRSHDLAVEAVQNTFLQIWEQRIKIDVSRNIAGLLSVMTRNNALKLLRHERAHARISSVLLGLANDFQETVTINDALHTIEQTELWNFIRDVLEGLPPRCREIFLLHWERGLTYDEIKQLLGISKATVANQMSRAMKHLTSVVEARKTSM